MLTKIKTKYIFKTFFLNKTKYIFIHNRRWKISIIFNEQTVDNRIQLSNHYSYIFIRIVKVFYCYDIGLYEDFIFILIKLLLNYNFINKNIYLNSFFITATINKLLRKEQCMNKAKRYFIYENNFYDELKK